METIKSQSLVALGREKNKLKDKRSSSPAHRSPAAETPKRHGDDLDIFPKDQEGHSFAASIDKTLA